MSGDLATSAWPVSGPLLQATTLVDEKNYPQATAALWAAGYLWTANETGLLTRWEISGQTYRQYRLPGEPVIYALAGDGQTIYLGTAGSGLWSLTADGSPPHLVKSESGRISALALAGNKQLWYADAGNFNRPTSRDQAGRGLVFMEVGREAKIHHVSGDEGDHPPLTEVTALIFDPALKMLWVGTRAAGVLGYDVNRENWQAFNTFNSDLANNTVNDLKQAPDGSLWLATAAGISVYQNGA
ncbi:MAG: two-component regulator propeller domain-containing protein, partial [Chloroflexota bacterium]